MEEVRKRVADGRGARRQGDIRSSAAAEFTLLARFVVLDLDGVSVNPMYWPARRREALNIFAIYRYHPMFTGADFNWWYPEQGERELFDVTDFGRASLEGGDVQPIGNGVVLIGMSERTQGRMIEQIAHALLRRVLPSGSSPASWARTAPICTSTPSSPCSTGTR